MYILFNTRTIGLESFCGSQFRTKTNRSKSVRLIVEVWLVGVLGAKNIRLLQNVVYVIRVKRSLTFATNKSSFSVQKINKWRIFF